MKMSCSLGISVMILLLLVCIIPMTVNAAGYTVSGYVFQDQNRNGIKDTGDPGMAGVTVTISKVVTTGIQPTPVKTTTNSKGYYTFSGLAAGTYSVVESVPQDYFNSTPSKATISIKTTSVTANFGNARYNAYVYAPDQLYVINTGSDAITKIISGLDNTYQLAETPDHKKAFVAGEAHVYVLNLSTNAITKTINVGGSWVAVRPDGKKAYVPNNNGYLYVIDTATYAYSKIYLGPNLGYVAITPDGKKAYVDGGGYMYILNTATNAVTKKYLGGTLGKIAITPDGKYAFVANGDGYLYSINVATGALMKTRIGDFMPGGMAITPDSRQIYMTGQTNKLIALNTATLARKTLTLPYTVASGTDNVVIARTGNMAYVSVGDEPDLSVIGYLIPVDTSTNTVKAGINTGAITTFSAITPDGKKIYSASYTDAMQPLIITNIPGRSATSMDLVQSVRYIVIG